MQTLDKNKLNQIFREIDQHASGNFGVDWLLQPDNALMNELKCLPIAKREEIALALDVELKPRVTPKQEMPLSSESLFGNMWRNFAPERKRPETQYIDWFFEDDNPLYNQLVYAGEWEKYHFLCDLGLSARISQPDV